MINGMMTLSGAWHKLRTDPILRFLVVSLSFYGMSTFEGPMMAIKTVNALSHNTDWTIGHVHSGALGWVAMISIGAIYHLVPKLWGVPAMYSTSLINVHFWLATVGTVLYIVAMWVNGIMQGLMWRAVNQDGTLTYSFVEALEASWPGYFVRFIGGAIFLTGMLVMAYNTYMTVRQKDAVAVDSAAAQPAIKMKHEIVEKNLGLMIVLIILTISGGFLAEVVPLFFSKDTNEPVAGLEPLSALELEGRDIYIREGCHVCHTQQIRPFRAETERYGHYSVAGEFVYERPFLWGSKRTGPDLARVGGRYSDAWQRQHLYDPRSVVPESNMPAFPWLFEDRVDHTEKEAKMK
ncbi:unnamed protein product, partial [Ectocarpus sp. 12 AP-2014]